MKYYLLTMSEDHGDEHNIPALCCMTEEEFNIWQQSIPNPYAFLGNGGGEYFLQTEYKKKYTGKDYIKDKIVDVTEVNEDFVNTFNKVGLAGLSLSGIFDEDEF